jgi:hypothetical protein
MENKCHSCLTFIKDQDRCNFSDIIKNNKSCPCRECILKIVCETACNKFQDLITKGEQWNANPRFIGRMMV